MKAGFGVRYNASLPLTGIALIALAGCAPRSAPSPDAASPCLPATMATGSWIRVDGGEFSFRLPPGFERVPAQGIDSNIGMFRSAQYPAEVSFDWGWYSNSLDNDPEVYSSYSRCSEVIGGEEATVITGVLRSPGDAAGPHVVAAAWRDVLDSETPVHLTIWATTRDPARLAELHAVLRTVEFDSRPSDPER